MSATPRFAGLMVSMLTDDDLPDLTDAEFRLWTMGLVKAVNESSRGVLRVAQPGRVQAWAMVSGGKEAVATAIGGLVEKGYWVLNGDGSVTIRNFDKHQGPISGMAAGLAAGAGTPSLKAGAVTYAADFDRAAVDENGDASVGEATLRELAAELSSEVAESLKEGISVLEAFTDAHEMVTNLAETLEETYPAADEAPTSAAFLRHQLTCHAVAYTLTHAALPRDGRAPNLRTVTADQLRDLYALSGAENGATPNLADVRVLLLSHVEHLRGRLEKPVLAYQPAFDFLHTHNALIQATYTHTGKNEKGNPGGYLRNELLGHAVGINFPGTFPGSGYAQLYSAAPSLGPFGHMWLVLATYQCAGKQVDGNPAAYILATARRMKSGTGTR